MARRLLPMLIVLLALAGCIAPQEDGRDEGARDAPDAGDDADASGCTQSATATPGVGGGGQSGVSNQPGSFSYGGQVAGKTGSEVYLWENPAPTASVMYGGQAGSGVLKLIIQDECGEEVYRKEMSGAAQQSGAVESTTAGDAGLWAITFEFTLYTGQMGVQISSA